MRTLPSVDPEPRRYACQCFEHAEEEGCWTSEVFWTQLGDPEPRQNLPWVCGGHPAAELPLRFGDRTILERAELVSEVVRAAEDPAGAELVLSLYHRTQTGSLERIVPETLAAAAMGSAPLKEPLKKLLARYPVLAPLSSFAKQLRRSSPERRAQLVDILAGAACFRPPGIVMEEMMALLRDEALRGAITSEQLRMLSNHDGEWLVAHVEALLARAPEHAGPILAWGGRSILMLSSFSAEGVHRTQALARKTGLRAEALVEQVDAASGIWPAETRRVVEAIQGMNPAQ